VEFYCIIQAIQRVPGFEYHSSNWHWRLKDTESWSLCQNHPTLPCQPAWPQELIQLVPTMRFSYPDFWPTLASSLDGRNCVTLFPSNFIRDVVIRAGDKWLRDIFVSATPHAVVFSVFSGSVLGVMDFTIRNDGCITTVLFHSWCSQFLPHQDPRTKTIPFAQRKEDSGHYRPL